MAVGQVTHKLKVGDNGKLEIYDYPGEYAQRFDGVDPGGGDRPADLQKIFDDNKRTVDIRMEQEAARPSRSTGRAPAGSSSPGSSSPWRRCRATRSAEPEGRRRYV